MTNYSEKASKSDLYARVKLAPVNAIQRAVAVNALRDADAITDAIMFAYTSSRWLDVRCRKLSSRSARSCCSSLPRGMAGVGSANPYAGDGIVLFGCRKLSTLASIEADTALSRTMRNKRSRIGSANAADAEHSSNTPMRQRITSDPPAAR